MTSLYNRATPRQKQVLIMMEGAIRNATESHPDWKFDPRLAKSIAKRATGTLTSQWGTVLAAPSARSKRRKGYSTDPDGNRKGEGTPLSGETRKQPAALRGGASELPWRTPLKLLERAIASTLSEERRSGDPARCEALVDVLRLISEIRALPVAPGKHQRFVLGRKG